MHILYCNGRYSEPIVLNSSKVAMRPNTSSLSMS